MFCERTKRNCFAESDLTFLFTISDIISKSQNINKDLELVLANLCKFLNAQYSMITIINRNAATIEISAAYGLTDAEKHRGVYKIGEGVIGEVVRTKKAKIIADVSKDPNFLNKTGIATDLVHNTAFLCIPIISEDEITGTLSIHKYYSRVTDFSPELKFMNLVGLLIGKNVALRQKQIEEMEQLRAENRRLKESPLAHRPDNIVGNSSLMNDLYGMIEKVAPINTTVMIRGESGVGKELIAEAIHRASARKNGPFIKVNCSALPETLIESELFGHEKGSFTGANAQHVGRFEMADGGTIFLDEIGEVPLSIQVKLLRVLQQRQFERVGGTKTIDVNVRVITATNRNLEEMIRENKFREDFYYRINVFPIYVPALRERRADIPILVDHFIDKLNRINGTAVKRITSGALDLLMMYHWPGNIRELENVIERAMVLSSDNVIRSYTLPPTLQTAASSGTSSKGTLNNVLEKVEKQMILDTLIATRGNSAKAAQTLGITERIMGLRIQKYQIDVQNYKHLSDDDNS
ncbi:sigma 54-interacting transcriptional regulator [Paludibacter sp.]|uniref:sigma-54 interaction domain-containing protein n=1 Tax=Paludibacter sp. TaxID=1898105 RepID=UPI001353D7F7|nr:sigma 54-interacting transcriptional regulator [Paludibacter sp.]MTK53666.1 GAF domain-containing protein [Paludibacter sp.]